MPQSTNIIEASAPRRRAPAAPVALATTAALLAVITYAGTIHNPFVYDDMSEVVNNTSLRDLGNVPEVLLGHALARPVTNLSYALDYARSQLDPVGYHATNVLLHGLNVVLLFVFTRRVVGGLRDPMASRADFIAFTAAGLLAVHPVMTEAVGYITGRSDLLVATFTLLSFLGFHTAFTAGGFRWWMLGALAFAIAAGTKETALILPLVLLLFDWFVVSGRDPAAFRRRLWRVYVPVLLLVFAAGLVRTWRYVTAEQSQSVGFAWQRLFMAIDVLGQYVALLVLPLKQSFVHGLSPSRHVYDYPVLRGLLILGVCAAIVVRQRIRRPLLALGITWTLAWLLPGLTSMLVVGMGEPFVERRAYLASCGLFIAVSAALAEWSVLDQVPVQTRPIKRVGTVAVLLLVLVIMTVVRNRVWSDPVLLWSDAVHQAPLTWNAHFGLADAYQSIGDCESAVPAYRRAIQLLPANPQAYDGLAACLAELDRSEEAKQVLREAIQSAPSATHSRVSLANMEAQAGNAVEALRLCRQVQELAPGTPDARACGAR